MVKGKTSSGFEFEIDSNNLDNMEFLDALAQADANVLMLSKVCDMLLGAEQKAKAYDFLRVDGRVPIQSVVELIAEIMNTAGEETKN